MNSMIERLVATHRVLNREIRREAAHRYPNEVRLKLLEKQRLVVKDSLFRHLPSASEMRRVVRALIGGSRARVLRS